MTRMKLSLLLIVVGLWGFKPDNIDPKPSVKRTDTIDVILDPLFARGINLQGLSSSYQQPIAQFYPVGKGKSAPVWGLAQWGSRFNLLGVKPVVSRDTVIYKNEGKKISFLKKKNEVLVNMEIYGSNEYPKPRKENEDWPHLLLGQTTNLVRIHTLKSLDFHIDARLMFDVNKMGEAYHEGMHTSQISFYLTVQNRNKKSKGYGDFFWFGLPLYDYRYKEIAEYGQADVGKEDATKKFILNVASNTLYKGSMHDGKWVTINRDIYPLLVDAFHKAKAKGYMPGTNLEDICISSTNLGWEVPGTFDCGIQLKGLKLKGVLKGTK